MGPGRLFPASGGALVVDPVGKAQLLTTQFDGKQCRENFVLPSSCYPRPLCCSLAFRSSQVKRLLSDLDAGGRVDPLGVFRCYLRRRLRW